MEKKEGGLTSNRRNFVKYGLTVLGIAVVGEELAIGAIQKYLSGAGEAAITDPHVRKRLLGGYEIVGKREIPGVGRVKNDFANQENMYIANGVIGTGDDDALDVIFSDDGKNLLIYANEAAFKNNGGDIQLNIGNRDREKVHFSGFENVAPGLYKHEINFGKLLQKYNLAGETKILVASADDDGDEIHNAKERGGDAVARVVLD